MFFFAIRRRPTINKVHRIFYSKVFITLIEIEIILVWFTKVKKKKKTLVVKESTTNYMTDSFCKNSFLIN